MQDIFDVLKHVHDQRKQYAMGHFCAIGSKEDRTDQETNQRDSGRRKIGRFQVGKLNVPFYHVPQMCRE